MSGVRAALRMATLGDGVRGKTTLFFASLLGEWRCPRDRPLQLRLRRIRPVIHLLDRRPHAVARIQGRVLDEDYRVGKDIAPRVIVDLGSNVGASLIYFRLCYPYARLIGVEADPVTFKRLQRNVAQFHGIEVVNAAVARESGMMPFLRYSGSSWANSLIPLWERTGQGHIAGRPLRRYGLMSVDLLNMDIEGAEWQVLPNFRQLDKVRTIIGEIHRIDQEAPRGLLECLSDFRVAVVAEAHHVAHFVATRD
ncbi:MAG: FkbM family methyltransferase [Solirubrobacterales bacterium]|nr:FkbM family methyltransferase [Solirubrobacterales bacterium]